MNKQKLNFLRKDANILFQSVAANHSVFCEKCLVRTFHPQLNVTEQHINVQMQSLVQRNYVVTEFKCIQPTSLNSSTSAKLLEEHFL